jgi:peptidoglycan/xylan/chitin deacetylase (PgdA/CDA1 family)
LWVSTLGALALVVRAWFEPIAGVWAALALLGLLLLVVAGVLTPRWEMFAEVLWCAPPGKHGIAFTFDDGPDPATTPRVLETLARHSARATFFVIGHKAEAHPELIVAMHEGGHALGVHTYRHERSYAFKSVNKIAHDLQRCREVLRRLTGQDVRLFRPPIGHVSPRTAAGAKLAQMILVGWTLRALDGLKRTTKEQVIARLAERLGDGAIVLLHDAAEQGERTPAGVDALDALLAIARQHGLECVALTDWTGSR